MDEDLHECWRDVRAPPAERTYHGVRGTSLGTCKVTVTIAGRRAKTLPLCSNVINHSPTGFEWGYSGSGPAQLALAILMDALGKDQMERAVTLHQGFKSLVVSPLPHSEWTLTRKQVLAAVARLEDRDRGS